MIIWFDIWCTIISLCVHSLLHNDSRFQVHWDAATRLCCLQVLRKPLELSVCMIPLHQVPGATNWFLLYMQPMVLSVGKIGRRLSIAAAYTAQSYVAPPGSQSGSYMCFCLSAAHRSSTFSWSLYLSGESNSSVNPLQSHEGLIYETHKSVWVLHGKCKSVVSSRDMAKILS